jgi:hypothetical protein
MVVFFLVYDGLYLNYIAIKLYKKISDRNFRRFLGRASLSHTTTPILNELLAAALRYRTPTSRNRDS